ncbi:MAG: aminopeptidase P family N-terminal domain-containing protein, partial [Rhodobacteraceae bacterium]|nr:aminopeptidase P family N-terminal domain-containing protein [Paracoccaceae bacterium]
MCEQVDTAIFEPLHLFEYGPEKWLGEEVREGMRIGYDPRLHTIGGIRSLRRAVEGAGGELVAVDDNPVDAVWADRPPPPSGRIVVQPDSLAGRSAADKIAGLREALAKAKADATVLTQPDSIAWTFNIRGGDVPHTPFALGFAIVPAEGRPLLAMDGRKFSNESRDHVEAVADIVEPGDFEARLREIAAGRRIMLDPNWAAASLARSVEEAGGTVVEGGDPAALPKATKNEAEIAGARAAHLRDAVAYARFLAWFDREGFKTDEIAVARKLEAFRSDTGELKDLSFDTISAAGGHAAIPHYRVTTATNLAIPPDSLFLIDSGAQFQDGTTDITRTIAVGAPPAEAVRRATLVLKGHIAIATAHFPEGTTGAQLDTLARIALWNAGLDFDHGTGHGVGSYLSVHEGPQRLAKTGHQPLRTGMI